MDYRHSDAERESACFLLHSQDFEKMKQVKVLLSALAAASSIALLGSLASPAEAYTVSLNGRTGGNPSGALYDIGLDDGDIGRTLDPLIWLVPANTSNGKETTPIALSASAILKVLNLTNNLLSLEITLFNNTTLPANNPNYRADIVSFGFGVTPNATGVTLAQSGNVFNQAEVQSKNQNFPGGFKDIDVCVYAGQNCSGGGNAGLDAGASDTLRLNIAGNFGNTPSVTLSDLALKFQTDNGSFEPAGVPEPLTILGSSMALGFGTLLKRETAKRRKQKQTVEV
jgi:hypothetical protein